MVTFQECVDFSLFEKPDADDGLSAAELTAKYNGGMAIYQIGEKGLLLDANISGSKYWLDEDLNK